MLTATPFRFAATLAVALLLAGCLSEAPPPAAGSEEEYQGAANHTSPYVGLENSSIRGLTAKEIEDLQKGAGMGLALPAELNGYPGPRHLLDMREELDLTPQQEAEIQGLYDLMNADARRVGAEVLEAHRALDLEFRNGTATEERLRARIDELAAKQADLRFIHLRTHLATIEILTPEQVAHYNMLRGYSSEGGAAHDHSAGHMGH